MFEKKNIYQIASVIVAVVLGAGFATGQELISFFVRFGSLGFAGILISGVLFAVSAWTVLGICHKKNIRSFNAFMLFVFGKKLSFFMETGIAMFLFVTFSTMLSAGGEVVREVFGLPFFTGGALIAVLCVLTYAYGLAGFVKANAAVAPLMVIGAIVIGLFTFLFDSVPAFFQEVLLLRDNWLFSAVLYTSYNMLTAISVLCSLSVLVTDKRTPLVSGLAAGAVISLLGICMSLPLFVNFNKIFGTEIPMLAITSSMGALCEYLYLLILIAAIYTTAVANGFAFTEWLKSNFNLDGMIIKILVTSAALICAHVGFSNFVTVLYPLFGYIGAVGLGIIIIRFAFLITLDK